MTKKLPDLAVLEAAIGHTFENRMFLETAVCHSSFVNEHVGPLTDNERLEFLGDAVLNLIVGHLLMERFPDVQEGDLSRTRANLVNERTLADVARKITLGSHMRLGRGELQTNGGNKNSILADAFEAVVAAVYKDGGFNAAFDFVARQFASIIEEIGNLESHYDAKSRLQEMVQVSHKTMPVYKVVKEEGPDHDKTFHVVVRIHNQTAEGVGKSKKAAEQKAARSALELLTGKRP